MGKDFDNGFESQVRHYLGSWESTESPNTFFVNL